MTVRELIERLEQLDDQDAEVVISDDQFPEGVDVAVWVEPGTGKVYL